MQKKVPGPPKHKIHAPWLQTLNKYKITTNDTIPASESFSFRDTGKWSGVAMMGQGHPTNMKVLKMTSNSS